VTVRSTLVMVPVFVNSKEGRLVLDLKADDFVLTDNVVPQLLTLEQDTDSQRWRWQSWLRRAVPAQPISLTIKNWTLSLSAGRQCGAPRHGHRFDGTPHLIVHSRQIQRMLPMRCNSFIGQHGANILDAIAFAVGQLRCSPPVSSCHFTAQRND